MIVEFFKRGTGGSTGPIDYFLGKDRNREHAKILSGDLEEVAELIDSSPYIKKYTAGCLSFYEDDLSDAKKKALMAAFEKTLFPGLTPDQYRIVWIEHKDKENAETGEKRLELNFLIPNVEITTGKRLQPFYAKADLNRVDDFKSIVNHKYQLFDPDDPMNRRSIKVAKNLPKDKKDFISDINIEVALAITEGLVSDRESLKSWMTDIGLEITRITKNQISVKNPNNPEGKPIPLKGEFYEQNFRHSEQSAELKREASERYRQEADSRYANCIERYKKLCESKIEYYLERYATRGRTDSEELKRQPEKQGNEHTSQYKQDGAGLEQRHAEDAREFTDSNTEFETGLADVKRIEPNHSRASEAEKSPVFIEYSPSFDSTYIAYYEHQLRLRQQEQIQRIEADQATADFRKQQANRVERSGEDERNRVSQKISKHLSEGKISESRSPVIEDHRRTTERARESIATHSTASSDNRGAKELHKNFKREAQRSSENCPEISADSAKFIRTNYFSEFFEETARELRVAASRATEKVSDEFEHQLRSSADNSERATEFSADRDREADSAIGGAIDEKVGLSTAVSRTIRGFDPKNIFKALDELERRELQLEQQRNRGYDSPSPF